MRKVVYRTGIITSPEVFNFNIKVCCKQINVTQRDNDVTFLSNNNFSVTNAKTFQKKLSKLICPRY